MKEFLSKAGWAFIAVCGFFIVMAQESYWCLLAIALTFISGYILGRNVGFKKLRENESMYKQEYATLQQTYKADKQSLVSVYEKKIKDLELLANTLETGNADAQNAVKVATKKLSKK